MEINQQQAVTAEVSGEKIQKVGFRAMIQKMAIQYNVAGWARNNPNGTVQVRLQGNTSAIDALLAAMRGGSKKSSQDNDVRERSEVIDPDLKTFTIFAWTSTSREIHTPYDLIFHLRPADDEISESQVQGSLRIRWH